MERKTKWTNLHLLMIHIKTHLLLKKTNHPRFWMMHRAKRANRISVKLVNNKQKLGQRISIIIQVLLKSYQAISGYKLRQNIPRIIQRQRKRSVTMNRLKAFMMMTKFILTSYSKLRRLMILLKTKCKLGAWLVLVRLNWAKDKCRELYSNIASIQDKVTFQTWRNRIRTAFLQLKCSRIKMT